jgi:hypothetical protein
VHEKIVVCGARGACSAFGAFGLLLCSAFQLVACNKESASPPPLPSAAPPAMAAPATAAPSATVAEPLAAPAPSEATSATAEGREDRRHHFEGHEGKPHERHPQ